MTIFLGSTPTNKIGDLFKHMAREKWNGSFPKDKNMSLKLKLSNQFTTSSMDMLKNIVIMN